MLKFDLDEPTGSCESFKKKIIFPEDRKGAKCTLHVLYPKPQGGSRVS